MTNRRHSPRKALILALLLPGLGQMYNGHYTKGLTLFLAFAFTVPLFSFAALNGPDNTLSLGMLLGVVATIGLYILSIVDAYRKAAAANPSPNRPMYAHTSLHTSFYLAAILFGHLCVFQPLAEYTRHHVVETFYIPSESMAPTLRRGDYIFADKSVHSRRNKRAFKRGDMVLFVYPNDRRHIYIKRIVGLPGDTITIEGTEVSVNGSAITVSKSMTPDGYVGTEETSDSRATYKALWPAGDAAKPLNTTVPNGTVFVLGDNRAAAKDSRVFGPIPIRDIVAIAKQVWFSRGESNAGFSRFGTRLDINS